MSYNNRKSDKNSNIILQIQQVDKVYQQGDVITRVLENISLSVEEGDFIALMGPSGSGKSTLLNIISGLDKPSSGNVIFKDEILNVLDESELAEWRSQHIGYIFQQYHLVPVLTAFENVELPLLLYDLRKSERKEHVETALSVVGLLDRMNYYPRQLSGGQEQRVGIARAIVTDPSILIADEPTGNLDENSSFEVLNLFEKLNNEINKTIIMVTHDLQAADRANRLYHLEKGFIKN